MSKENRKIEYIIDGELYELECAETSNNYKYLANVCAEDYFDNQGGSDDIVFKWPLNMELLINGENFGIFQVELEWSPYFVVNQLEQENGN